MQADANDRVWSLNEETEKAVANLAAVGEKYEEVVNLMLTRTGRWTEACMAVDMASQAMEEAVRATIEAKTRHRNVVVVFDDAEFNMNRALQ